MNFSTILNASRNVTYFHEPMIIILNVARIGFINFDDWQKILVCYQNLILVVQYAGEINTAINAQQWGYIENGIIR